MRAMLLGPSIVFVLGLSLNAGTAHAMGDRAGDVRMSFGDTGLSGQIFWGDEGIRLDFAYPSGPGRSERVTLAIRQETGDAILLLHGAKEALVGTWTLSGAPTPLDLLEPALGERSLSPVGEVQLGKLRCSVLENTSQGHLKVWAPVAYPDIPRLARNEGPGGGAAAEISLSNVRMTHLASRDLAIPPDFDVHPFSLQEMLSRASGLPASAELGARMLVWMSGNNLERQIKDVEYAMLIESQEEAQVAGE